MLINCVLMIAMVITTDSGSSINCSILAASGMYISLLCEVKYLAPATLLEGLFCNTKERHSTSVHSILSFR